jgi:hypothetical protein
MAKKNRSAKAARKARQHRATERAAMRGKGSVSRGRNMEVLGMILGRAGRAGNHGDARKEQGRKGCRGKIRED